jgi:hypothetical protein
MTNSLSRREFLQWSSLAGIAPAFVGGAIAAEDPPGVRMPDRVDPAQLEALLPKDYLFRGIQALSDAHRFRWAEGHHGAAVIAGYSFCRENPLDERTLRAVRKHLDDYIASQPAIFSGKGKPEGAPAPVDRIVETLAGHMSELRGAAHDQIFGALAVKALRDAPEMAVAPVVDGVCQLLKDFVRRFAPEDSEYNRQHPMKPYENDQDLIQATFLALQRPRAHLAKQGVVGAIHWVTQADALVTLAECGYRDVARLGYAAHQAFINHPVLERDAATDAADPAAAQWLEAEYWESDQPRRPRSRSWLNGHTLKLPFSLFRLAKHLKDPAKLRGIDRAPWLVREYERAGG